MIPESFKQDLLNRVDIVDVIERYVPLKKSGANLSACCPFHTEKTPSFTVSPSKQFYHCFGCGAHGNVISFVMEYQGLGYVEAMRDLAESVSMKLPEFQPQQKREESGSDRGPDLQQVLERAARFYREQLKTSERAITYLKGRGLTGAIAARFGIGYAPDAWQGLESVFPDYQDKSLIDAGLVIQNEQGRRYDRFRDRVMFPILNQRGAVIGFGGRVIGDGEPKYLNSPETSLFEKGRELYGLSQARVPIREAGKVLVVEGYMDVVALAQHGIGYAVATLGTATSAVHVEKLLRQTDNVVFCFDGDAAGRRAAWHALEVSLPLVADHKSLRFLFLPPEDDPDSFVRAHGREMFEARVAKAQPLSEYLLDELKSRVDMSSIEGRARLMHEAKPLLQKMAARVMQLQLLQEFAGVLGIAVAEVATLCGIAGSRAPAKSTPNAMRQRTGEPRADRADKAALMSDRLRQRAWLRRVTLVPELAGSVPQEMLTGNSPETQLLAEVVRLAESEGIGDTRHLLEHLSNGPHQELVRWLAEEHMENIVPESDLRKEFDDALVQIEEGRLNAKVDQLREKELRDGLSEDEKDEYRRMLAEIPKLKDHRAGRVI